MEVSACPADVVLPIFPLLQLSSPLLGSLFTALNSQCFPCLGNCQMAAMNLWWQCHRRLREWTTCTCTWLREVPFILSVKKSSSIYFVHTYSDVLFVKYSTLSVGPAQLTKQQQHQVGSSRAWDPKSSLQSL